MMKSSHKPYCLSAKKQLTKLIQRTKDLHIQKELVVLWRLRDRQQQSNQTRSYIVFKCYKIGHSRGLRFALNSTILLSLVNSNAFAVRIRLKEIERKDYRKKFKKKSNRGKT